MVQWEKQGDMPMNAISHYLNQVQKDRKGRLLSYDDLTHYQHMVSALGGTIRLMAEIDKTIDKHGGWPIT